MDDYMNLLKDWLGEGGLLAQSISSFRFRQEQLDMSEQIMRAMLDHSHLLAEAGTGVGKTYAYLLPAILWAANHCEDGPVVISTRTRALQEQISDRDLPQLCKHLRSPLVYEEAKGRENYLCWHKYEQIRAGKVSLRQEEEKFYTAIMSWAEQTISGDRKELRLSSEQMRHWPIVAADRMSCLRGKCSQREKCFRLKMTRRLDKADLIICNHALLLSDLDHNIVPEYKCLIIDEAHSISREAFDRLSFRVSWREIQETLQQLYFQEGYKVGGLLHNLALQQEELLPTIDEIRNLMEDFKKYSLSFFQQWQDYAKNQGLSIYAHVLNQSAIDSSFGHRAVEIYQDWQQQVQLLAQKLEQLGHAVLDEELPVTSYAQVLMEYGDALYYIMEEQLGRNDCVSWLDFYREQVDSICSATIFSGETLRERLIDQVESMIMVSATLTVEGNFDSFIYRCGLEDYRRQERLVTVRHQSPFEYERLAALFCVEDLPESIAFSLEQETLLYSTLEQICHTTSGRTLILFTARKQLERASRYLRERLRQEQLEILVQHEDGEFATLIGEFSSKRGRILLGLETYWEGIDLKGEQLTCVVIVRLPFRSPTDPYAVAWERYYQLLGRSSFNHFTVPDAALRFKQGIGRLIRSEEDHGAVIVLDSRIIKKNYGQRFLSDIPIGNQQVICRSDLASSIAPWV